MLIPALYQLEARKELTVPVIGVALTDLDLDGAQRAAASLKDAGVTVDEAVFARFSKRLHLVAGSFDSPDTFTDLKKQLGSAVFQAYYLAVPPSLFGVVASGLHSADICEGRLVVDEAVRHRRPVRARAR